MPTPSGHETADEKRERQRREKWLRRQMAAAPLVPAARREALGFMTEVRALRDDETKRSFERLERHFGSQLEADAFADALREAGFSRISQSVRIKLFAGQQPDHTVEVVKDNIPGDLEAPPLRIKRPAATTSREEHK
jgi:hypothetical protein